MDSVEPNQKLRGIVHRATDDQLLVYLDSGLIGLVCPPDVDDLASKEELATRFDEGEIVERGTHDELIRQNGYYKKLNDMQAL